MPRRSPIVLLESVDVDIAGRAVLKAIDLALYPRQHMGIVGDNGSGKSTLLALIAGQRWPAPGRGRRSYDFGNGRERDAVTARQRVAILGHELQDLYRARNWNFRARDIVLSGLTRSDIPQRNPAGAAVAEADALLDTMGLAALADRRLLELSRGEQRRVLIARALAFGPALLLLDEPASGLDADARSQLDALLTRVAATTQIVTAAHRTEQLPALAQEVVEIERGCIVARTAARRGEPPTRGLESAGSRTTSADQSGIREPETKRDTALPDNGTRARGQADASGSEPIIELENASVWLGERRILDRVSWRLARGEHWLVTGDNGAGKSTFLRLLHGQLRPALGGHIRWPGLGNPHDVWSLRRRIALVSAELQAGYLYPSTVFETIASGFSASIGLTRPVAAAERQQVEALMAAFELDTLSDRSLRALSYGQRHRTLIARTLCTEPRVVLLDEPWEGLDARSAALVTAELGRRMQNGLQIVCVSHLGAGALPLNRCCRIDGGKLVESPADEDSWLRGSDDVRAALRESSASALRPAKDFPQH